MVLIRPQKRPLVVAPRWAIQSAHLWTISYFIHRWVGCPPAWARGGLRAKPAPPPPALQNIPSQTFSKQARDAVPRGEQVGVPMAIRQFVALKGEHRSCNEGPFLGDQGGQGTRGGVNSNGTNRALRRPPKPPPATYGPIEPTSVATGEWVAGFRATNRTSVERPKRSSTVVATTHTVANARLPSVTGVMLLSCRYIECAFVPP